MQQGLGGRDQGKLFAGAYRQCVKEELQALSLLNNEHALTLSPAQESKRGLPRWIQSEAS